MYVKIIFKHIENLKLFIKSSYYAVVLKTSLFAIETLF